MVPSSLYYTGKRFHSNQPSIRFDLPPSGSSQFWCGKDHCQQIQTGIMQEDDKTIQYHLGTVLGWCVYPPWSLKTWQPST